jgi:hypothetical protein
VQVDFQHRFWRVTEACEGAVVLLWLIGRADILLMNRIFSVLAAALGLLFAGLGAHAQLPGGGQSGVNAAMLKLFSDISGFTSKAEARLTDRGTKEVTTMTIWTCRRSRASRSPRRTWLP